MPVPQFPPPVSVLAVCTGNICRSPAAERLLAAMLGDGVHVGSAGTHALVGEPISAPMVPLLQSAGADTEGFAARQLTGAIVRPTHLVLAMTRAHRAAAVEVWPGAVRRAFTLREFARLLADVDAKDLAGDTVADRLMAAIPLAASRRAAVAPGEDNVVDPYRRGDGVYVAAFDQILPAVQTIARAVGAS